MSTPGGDKPDLPDFGDFDLPTDGLPPLEDDASSDLPDAEMIPIPEPLEEITPADLSADSPVDESAEESPMLVDTSETEAESSTEAESPTFAVDQGGEAVAEAEEGSKKKKKKKPAKRKKEKKAAAEDGQGVLQKIGKASPYTVMLGLSIIALVIAVVCLVMELAQFNYDFKAQEIKQRAALTAPLHSVPVRITAAA